MACSCEGNVLILQNSLCLKRNVCWTQLCKNPLLMLHAGFATDTQQLLQRGLMSYHYHQVLQPTLQLFLSSTFIAQYVSFHIAAHT